MQDLIKEFMGKKCFAVVGATDNTEKYGNRIVKNLKKRGYEVYPVNPNLEEVEGIKCYPDLYTLPCKVDVVDFVVPPRVTEAVLQDCEKLDLKSIWLQPGSESEAAIDYCHRHGMQVVHDVCVMMS